jgi:DNA-binding transcriptional LysR family regulator
VNDAVQTVDSTRLNPGGVLRVTASLPFCMKHIAPLLPAFTQRYPNLRVQLIAANRYFDIIDNNVDIAVRTREYESDSNVTIRRLAEMLRVVSAARRYLDSRGTPTNVAELAQHDLLVYSYANHPDELRFTQGDTLLTDWQLPKLTINIAYASRQHLPAKARVFIDFLVEHFRQMDYERRWNARTNLR